MIRFRMMDGTYHEVEVTDGQLLDYGAGHGISPYTVRDERITVDDDGTVTTHEPRYRSSTTRPNPRLHDAFLREVDQAGAATAVVSPPRRR